MISFPDVVVDSLDGDETDKAPSVAAVKAAMGVTEIDGGDAAGE